MRQVVILGLLLLTLSGCQFSGNALVDADQVGRDGGAAAALEPGQPVGQTFVARHGGLAGIEFFLIPNTSSAESLTLHLRPEPQAETDLATATLQLPPEAEPGFYRFTFSPAKDSHGQYYYAFVEGTQPGISVALGPGEAYLDGAAHEGHHPLDAQTSFRLVYAPAYVGLDLLGAVWGWLGLLAAAGLLFVVPGWALLAWLWPGRPLSWAETLGLAVGISLALYPVLFLWTDLIGVHLGAAYAWLPVACGVSALLLRHRSRLVSLLGRWPPRLGAERLRAWVRSEALWPDLTLLVLLGLVFGVRLLVVRSLDAPMWGDSYQHTMIAQLLVDNGGLFESWLPYAEIDRFTYHFGFHSAVAVLHWLTALPPIEATLWTGQLLNGLAVLALYPLAVRVTGSRWGGVWAVLLAGLLSPMPMFYTNWGRYTQLAGQAILPAAVWLTWDTIATNKRPWQRLILAILTASGLALTHYRVLLFYGAFALSLMLMSLLERKWRPALTRLGGVAVGSMVVFAPWVVNLAQGYLMEILGDKLSTLPRSVQASVWEYNQISGPETFLAPLWWLALLIGLGLGLWRRQRGALVIGLWWFLLLIAANPAWLSLPGTGIISNFALFIASYVPGALLSALLAAFAIQRLRGTRWRNSLAALLFVFVGLWGARDRLGELDPVSHALVTRPDIQAAAWIRDTSPPTSLFLVNSFFAYGGSILVGSDAGWWLPLLALRDTTLPPITYNNELLPTSNYRQRIHDIAYQVQQKGPDDPAVLALLRGEKVTHAYIGQRQGRVNYGGSQVLDPEVFLRSEAWEVIYHQDRIWVFQLSQ
jgi:hypothetical protein